MRTSHPRKGGGRICGTNEFDFRQPKLFASARWRKDTDNPIVNQFRGLRAMITAPPVCVCSGKHYRGAAKCDAFPDKIPDVIWLEGDPHTKPVEGDHDIIRLS